SVPQSKTRFRGTASPENDTCPTGRVLSSGVISSTVTSAPSTTATASSSPSWATTATRSASGNSTWRLAPSSTNPSPSAVSVAWIPSSDQPVGASATATVPVTPPAATGPSSSPAPASRRNGAYSVTVVNSGPGASTRPSSSTRTASST